MKTLTIAMLLFAASAIAGEAEYPSGNSTALDHLPATYWISYTPPREVKKPIKSAGEKQAVEKARCEASVPVAGAYCADAKATISLDICRPSYTEQGLRSFAALFSAAAERGVENATIRAMNQLEVKPAGSGKK